MTLLKCCIDAALIVVLINLFTNPRFQRWCERGHKPDPDAHIDPTDESW